MPSDCLHTLDYIPMIRRPTFVNHIHRRLKSQMFTEDSLAPTQVTLTGTMLSMMSSPGNHRTRPWPACWVPVAKEGNNAPPYHMWGWYTGSQSDGCTRAHTPAMCWVCNLRLERWKQEDQGFKAILHHMANLKIVWAIWNSSLKENKLQWNVHLTQLHFRQNGLWSVYHFNCIYMLKRLSQSKAQYRTTAWWESTRVPWTRP